MTRLKITLSESERESVVYNFEMGNPRNRARKASRKRKNTSSFQNECVTLGKQQKTVIGDTPVADERPSQDHMLSHATCGVSSSTPLSRSGRKLKDKISTLSGGSDDNISEDISGYVLFDCSILSELFELLCCPVCATQNLKLVEVEEKRKGFSVSFRLICQGCAWEKDFASSNSINISTKRSMEVNVRMVLGFRNIGCGFEALNSFSMIMNMRKPMTRDSYSNLIDNIHSAYLEEAEASMKEAVEEVKSQTGATDFTASFDGTWQKPGFSSLNGVVSAISNFSGKVLDFEVKSKYCKACERKSYLDKESLAHLQWQIRHKASCSINHQGSSGAMEVDGLRDIFLRSVKKYGIRYTTFIGDGDSSSYATISEEKPYGPDIIIDKKECIGHVQKRLGTRLRKLKSSLGNRKLKDGKCIGGKGRLTQKMINKMQNYYGLAIRANKNNLEGMINDVKAGLYHIASSDSSPQHSLCPKGKDSWCAWQRNKTVKKKDYKHTSYLPKAVFDEVLPIYKDLSEETLLSRCLDSFTQNPNESLNKLIWARCPKKIHQGRKVVELSTASAVAHFNDGASSIARVLDRLGMCPGKHTNFAIHRCDNKRIFFAEKKSSETGKSRRKKLRAIRKGLWDHEKEKEGNLYESGGH